MKLTSFVRKRVLALTVDRFNFAHDEFDFFLRPRDFCEHPSTNSSVYNNFLQSKPERRYARSKFLRCC